MAMSINEPKHRSKAGQTLFKLSLKSGPMRSERMAGRSRAASCDGIVKKSTIPAFLKRIPESQNLLEPVQKMGKRRVLSGEKIGRNFTPFLPQILDQN